MKKISDIYSITDGDRHYGQKLQKIRGREGGRDQWKDMTP
jgi:hypothetical protein